MQNRRDLKGPLDFRLRCRLIPWAAVIAGVLSIASPKPALAAPANGATPTLTLKQVQVSGNQVNLLFDGKVSRNQVRPEFFNDVIQFSLTDVSVYPAKISSVNGPDLVKIFAYQYAPKLVRCRLTVKGKAEDFKDKVQVVENGKVLTFKIGVAAAASNSKTDSITQSSAQAVQAKAEAKENVAPKAAAKKEKEGAIETAETELLEHVMKSSPGKSSESAAEKKAEKSKEKSESNSKNSKNSEKSLAGGKPLPSPMGVLGKLAAVIGLFGLIAMGVNRFRNKGKMALNRKIEAGARRGLLGSLAGIAQSAKSGLGRREKLIEVLSTHYLGPKKNIAVVKIMGRILVLGVSNDAINLITQINEDNLDDLSSLEDLGILGATGEKAASSPARGQSAQQAPVSGPRAPAGASAAGPAVGAWVGQNAYSRSEARPESRNDARQDIRQEAAIERDFSSLLQSEKIRPSASAPIPPQAAAPTAGSIGASNGVRSQIRSRLEGLKQL